MKKNVEPLSQLFTNRAKNLARCVSEGNDTSPKRKRVNKTEHVSNTEKERYTPLK